MRRITKDFPKDASQNLWNYHKHIMERHHYQHTKYMHGMPNINYIIKQRRLRLAGLYALAYIYIHSIYDDICEHWLNEADVAWYTLIIMIIEEFVILICIVILKS